MDGMGEGARAELESTRRASICEKCGARCELDGDAAHPRLRCSACDHAVDVALVAPSAGRWTVVDPEGIVRHFSSWQELIGSLPIAGLEAATGARGTRSSSAAALLDVTPAPPSTGPRLSLVSAEDVPPIPPLIAPKIAEESLEELPDEDILPASDDGRAALGRSAAPASAVHVSVPPPLPASASLRPPAISVAPPPPPPKGGTLKTLPPSARHDLPAPPPPTIDVESDPVLPVAEESGPRIADAEPRAPIGASLRRPEAAAGRGWMVPVAVLGVLALGLAYLNRAPAASPRDESSASTTPTSDPRAASTSTSTTSVLGSAPSTSASAASASASAATASASASASAGAPGDPRAASNAGSPERRAVGDSQLSLPEVLERAALARKSGDAPHAKALLERALELSPGNAEAYGLLGDLARSQGDQAAAKSDYEKALATSPSYFPAQVGLADTEWDLGERDAAQRHYIAILALGRPTPERVKERALGGGTTSATSTPSATSSASGATSTSGAASAPASTGAAVSPAPADNAATEP